MNYKQALFEVFALLCASILIIFLVAMVAFITVKGSQYFLPQAAYKVTLTFPTAEQEVFYQASGRDAAALQAEFDERYKGQFLAEPQSRPQVDVHLAEQVYQVVSKSGRVYFGEFYGLLNANEAFLPLSELTNLQNTVDLLQSNLTEVQQGKLRELHRRIATLDNTDVGNDTPARKTLMQEYIRWQNHANELDRQIEQYRISFKKADNTLVDIGLNELDFLYQPNQLSSLEKIGFTLTKIWQFVSDTPKQASTTGGVFPAIFGTVLMVILMAVVVAPFGIIAAVYLHEYAPENKTTQLIRIGISNMAAVPSVVYGVFGLGFFVYTMGGSIDELFYPQALPSPTFGTPGLLWASLTMGLLTLPVVIVSAEEGLQRVPEGLRSGSYALGATKFETIMRVVVPMASPGMLTGIILAIARAAGEVAPLILVGAVKFAPNLPIDGEYPFVHLERQFMHLGVFIYDGAFHNQTQTQSASLMFATCMLLLIIVFLLNISAILIRHRLRHKYERA
ncbi:phosphate ABC transporter permease PstA [Glaciecola siphonariae]|uniref:Phosphate transport system permease protein PstA n=1 Tax=Glaciecola siphonariae TaxID=521012 RepID=A0ABV9LUW0_9ALTE